MKLVEPESSVSSTPQHKLATSAAIETSAALVVTPAEPPEDVLPTASAIATTSAPLRYNPARLKEYYRRRPLQVVSRWWKILWPVVVFVTSRWWDRKTGQVDRKQRQRAVQLREILTRLGPAYIKIGQALSSRPDLLPASYLDELAKLQDQLPPFDNELAYQFIEEELGGPPHQIYAELTPAPIAAASLGQVYKGKLPSGEAVAVKVQRPGLADSIGLDIYILRGLARWAQKNIKSIRSDLVGILDEFAERLFEEMDYVQEGRNAEHFQELYGHLNDIYVPRIYWGYTNHRVLTMEWITGVKLTQPEAVRTHGVDARYLIEVGVQCSLRQLLEHGFFHADPHPGNLLAMPTGKLAFLDFGMMSQIQPEQRYGLINAIVHIVNRDFEGLVHDYVKLGFLKPETDLAPIIPELTKVFNNALGASVAELNFQSIVNQLSELMYEYPFQVPAYYALIIRSLVTLEGIAITVDPNFKVLSAAYPYVAKRLLTDPAPELRTSLNNLLFKEERFRWNRLENLLRHARDSSDFDFDTALGQALDYLFSERGDLIRNRLTEELIKAVDSLGRSALQRATSTLRQQIGLDRQQSPAAATDEQQTLEHLKRIWGLVQETPGFDPMKLVPVISRLLVKPETQRMGQRIAGGLAQRLAARLIREVMLPGSQKHPTVSQVALPQQPVRLSPNS